MTRKAWLLSHSMGGITKEAPKVPSFGRQLLILKRMNDQSRARTTG